MTRAPSPVPGRMDDMHFPLRKDHTITLRGFPRDMTTSEAAKLERFIKTLVIPEMKPTTPKNPRVAVIAAVGDTWTGIAELRKYLNWPTYGKPQLTAVVKELVKEGTLEAVDRPAFRFRKSKA